MPPDAELPPLDMGGDLDMGGEAEDAMMLDEEELNPGFAAEAELAFPELDDDGLMALQRAVQALL